MRVRFFSRSTFLWTTDEKGQTEFRGISGALLRFLPRILFVTTGAKNNASCMIFVKSHHVPGTGNMDEESKYDSDQTEKFVRCGIMCLRTALRTAASRSYHTRTCQGERRTGRVLRTAVSRYLLLLVKQELLLGSELLQHIITAVRLPESGK